MQFKKLAIIALSIALSSCSLLGPKPEIIYQRPDLNTKLDKLIIFPTTDFSGKSSAGSKSVDLSINASWASVYAKENIIPAGPAIAKIADGIGNDFYKNFISALDNVSAVEQIANNPTAKKFVNQLTEKFGSAQFGVAIISGGESEYNSSQPVHLHIGLFDANNMTWKIITKIEGKKGPLGKWQVDSQMLVSNSFNEIKKISK
jgi:hypothetical protein